MPTDKLEDFVLHNRSQFDEDAPADDLWDRIEATLPDEEKTDDPLEGFVLENRDAFDDTSPPPRLEGRVFAALDEQSATVAPLRALPRHRRLVSVMGIAASLLLLLTAAFVVGNSRGYRAAQEDRVALELKRIDPDMAAAEAFYRGEIATRYTQVAAASDDPQLLEDLAAIDEATQEIRNSLLEVPVSQRPDLVNQLIATYRTKLEILQRVQQLLPPSATRASTSQSTENET